MPYTFRLKQNQIRNSKEKFLKPVNFKMYINIFFSLSEHDPAPIFFDQKVQELLKRVTGMDFDKIFRGRLNEKVLEVPKYEFLTDSELEEVSCKVGRRGNANSKDNTDKMLIL